MVIRTYHLMFPHHTMLQEIAGVDLLELCQSLYLKLSPLQGPNMPLQYVFYVLQGLITLQNRPCEATERVTSHERNDHWCHK